jgi:hypothetical protein
VRKKRPTMEKGGEYWKEKTKGGNENENGMSGDCEMKGERDIQKKKKKKNSKEREKNEMRDNLRTKRPTIEEGGEHWMEKTKWGNEYENGMDDDGEMKNERDF